METDDEFIIVLHIAEGVGLDLKNENVVITATLGGNKLETETIKSANSTLFDNNLIWDTDKNSIKKMKTENLPIKVECFSVNLKNGQELRTQIGYILLPIRGIPIVSQNKAVNTKPRWNKLVGLTAEWKPKKPEILLFLIITEKQNLDPNGGILLSVKNPTVENVHSIPVEPCNTTDMLTSQNGLHIKLLEDQGLLQVGNFEIDCDVFIVKLMFKCARNLEHIVNPEEQMNQLFQFHYNLLGSPTYCALTPKGNGIYSVQEKIAIHFRTSLIRLNEYFDKVLYIPIDLYYNDTIIGHARYTFSHLINHVTDLEEFRRFHEMNDNTLEIDGTFPIETLFDLPPTALTPFVEYTFSLKYLSTTKVSNCEIILDKSQTVEYIDKQAGGDNNQNVPELPPTKDIQIKDNEFELRSIQSDSILLSNRNLKESQNHINKKVYKPKIIRSNPIIPQTSERTDIEALLTEKNESKPKRNVPRTFSFNLILQTVRFTRRPEIGIWQITLNHSKADTPFTIANVELTEINSNLIEFKNLELQLFFASSADEILHLIESESCALNINGPRGMQASAELDSEIVLVGTKEKRSGVILMENQSGEKIAMAHIFVYLDDLGFNFNSQIKKYTNLSQGKSQMDETLAYKIVEELEDWKAKQQEIFLIELKRKEVNHLAHLSSEWQKKKTEQEIKLAEKLEQCSMLTAALEEAHKTLKEKGIHQIEKERFIEQTKLELEQTYSIKLLELKEKARRLEDDMSHQLQLNELKFRELEMSKTLIEKDNEKLLMEIKKFENQIIEMKKNFLPREQLAGLFQDLRILSERLDEVQKSKIFYKNQWAKIIREVHKMKSENLQQMELQIKQNHSFGLKDFLSTEHRQLLSEREQLNFIRDALDSDDSMIEKLSVDDKLYE